MCECFNSTNLLGDMLYDQEVLDMMCGVYSLPKEQQIKTRLTQLIVEAGEALAPLCTETKPWKPPFPSDLSPVDEEVIDVLHYVLSYAIVRGWDGEELAIRYFEKNKKNQLRVKEKLDSMKGSV